MVWSKEVHDEIDHKSIHGRSSTALVPPSDSMPSLDSVVVAPSSSPLDPESVSLEFRLPPHQTLPAPLFVVDFPLGTISAPAKIGVALGCSLTGTAFVVGDGRPLLEEQEVAEKNGGIPFLKWGKGRQGIDASVFHGMAAVVIDAGIAEFPTLHPAADRHAAEVYGVESGAVSHHLAHADLSTTEDLTRHVELLREVTDHAVPIIVKFTGGKVYDEVTAAAEARADAVWLESLERWRPAVPQVLRRAVGLPLLGLFGPARQALRNAGAEDRTSLMVSGGIRNSADVLRCLALGADMVGIDTAALVALGCRQGPACAEGKCPEGIVTHDAALAAKLQPERAGKRLANFLHVTQEEVRVLMGAVGAKDLEALAPEALRAVTYDTATWTGLKLVGYDSQLPMWMH